MEKIKVVDEWPRSMVIGIVNHFLTKVPSWRNTSASSIQANNFDFSHQQN